MGVDSLADLRDVTYNCFHYSWHPIVPLRNFSWLGYRICCP